MAKLIGWQCSQKHASWFD